MPYTFEDKSDEIDIEIAKRRHRWRLDAISYMDYEDVAQMIRLHIYNKWHLWDQKKPLPQWVNKVITNRMINILRDNYGRFAPPCNGCTFNTGGNLCSFTQSGERSSECPLYREWEKTKKRGYNLKLASSLDSEDVLDQPERADKAKHIDYSSSFERMNNFIKKQLSKQHWEIYQMMYIECLSDKDIAKKLNLKTNEKGRNPGYNHLLSMRKKFAALARKVVYENDIVL